MNPVLFSAAVVFVWISSLFNGTGLGSTYHTDRITIMALLLISILLLLRKRRITVPTDIFYAFGGTTAIFIGSSLYHGYGLSGAQYLCCFLVVYIFSQIRIRDRSIRLAGLAVLALGAAILLIYNYGTQLAGWNGNNIAMIGLFSYILFVAAFYHMRFGWAKLVIILVGIWFYQLTIVTDSRSCMFSLIVAMAVSVLMKSTPYVLSSRGVRKLWLLIPLLVVIVTVVISLSGGAAELDAWSQENFGKPIFNGRDLIWLDGLQSLAQNPLFGSGNINANRWHNTAIACLTSFGVAGYLFWLGSLNTVLRRGSAYLSDPVVTGCMMAFLIMNMQQSVELGMFALNPNLLIYLPLGLILGRIRYLKERSS